MKRALTARIVLIVAMAASLVGCSFGKLLLDVQDGKLGKGARSGETPIEVLVEPKVESNENCSLR